MSSALTKRSSSHGGGMSSTPNSGRPSQRSATAARLLSAAMWSMWSSAIRADIWSTRTTPAATGTARSVGRWPAQSGWRQERRNCCRFPISMSCLRCRNRSPRWRCRMRARSTASCSAPRRQNTAYHRGRSQTSGRSGRLSRCHSMHVGAEPSSASASALHRAGRRY